MTIALDLMGRRRCWGSWLSEAFESILHSLRPAERAILVSLEDRGDLRSTGRGRWEFVDPLLAEWLRGAFSLMPR